MHKETFRKINYLFAIIATVLVLGTTSCDSSEDPTPTTPPAGYTLADFLGTWTSTQVVYGGKTFGALPYTLLDIAPGNELHYYNKYAFNMMNRWEFIHDTYAGVNFEHNIGNGIFRLFPKLRLRQFWTAKALWGSLSATNKALNFKAGHNFQSLDGKSYLELGTGVDNIFKVFRVDFVWRVLPSTLPKVGDKTFGIFGSFRVVF